MIHPTLKISLQIKYLKGLKTSENQIIFYLEGILFRNNLTHITQVCFNTNLLESDSLSLLRSASFRSCAVLSFCSSSPDSPKTSFNCSLFSSLAASLSPSSSLESPTGRAMRDFLDDPLFGDPSPSESEPFPFILRLRDAFLLPTLEPEEEADLDPSYCYKIIHDS